MISRLTAYATVFAIVGTATLAVAAGSPGEARSPSTRTAAGTQAPVVHLAPVVITVKRTPRAPGVASN